MRERLTQFASVAALVVSVGLSPSARAQQETKREPGDQKSTAHANEMIHGIVAGIAAEGEVFYNHQTNTAVKAEGAFLTVVGSPVHPDAHEKDRAAETTRNERHAGASARAA